MHLEYIEYLIVPDQIQSDCKARAEVPTAQSTNSTKPPCFYPLGWLQVFIYSIPRLGFTLCYFQYRCSITDPAGFPFCLYSWPGFLAPKESGEVPRGEFWRAGVLWRNGRGSPHSSFCSQHPRKIRQGRHTGKEKVSKDYFYAFLAVGAVSDQCVHCLSITSSSPFSSQVPLVPLLPYFSIHLHDF